MAKPYLQYCVAERQEWRLKSISVPEGERPSSGSPMLMIPIPNFRAGAADRVNQEAPYGFGAGAGRSRSLAEAGVTTHAQQQIQSAYVLRPGGKSESSWKQK